MPRLIGEKSICAASQVIGSSPVQLRSREWRRPRTGRQPGGVVRPASGPASAAVLSWATSGRARRARAARRGRGSRATPGCAISAGWAMLTVMTQSDRW